MIFINESSFKLKIAQNYSKLGNVYMIEARVKDFPVPGGPHINVMSLSKDASKALI